MKCPNCKAKLSFGAYIFNHYKCKSCGAVISVKPWLGIFAVLISIPVGKLVFAEEYVFALLLTLIFLIVYKIKIPSSIKADLKNNTKK